MKRKIFLAAEWRKLIMANYKVEPSVLLPHLPAGTELDYRDNDCYVSLVGFLFKDVRVMGCKIPFHVEFPEVNLRFYVRYKDGDDWKRGVVFISEIVPKPAITLVANTFFNENYSTLPMKYSWKDGDASIHINYQWKKNRRWNRIEAKAGTVPEKLKEGSVEEFITEHFWGYSIINNERIGEYHVEHPRWDIYEVTDYLVACDFAALYGNEFAFLSSAVPDSVLLAEGSPVKVSFKKVLSIPSLPLNETPLIQGPSALR